MSTGNSKEIKSVQMFVDEITTIRREEVATNVEQWFFRGQKNSKWDVRPNIFRGDDLASEHILIERAQRQNPIEFRECVNNFETLTKLQHYGLGTRLLDVTLNPLVALFFATEFSNEYVKNNNGQYSRQEHDGIVFYRFIGGCFLQDIHIRIALAVPFAEFGKSMTLDAFCNWLVEQDTITPSEHERLIADNYADIIRILQTNSFIISTNSNVRLIQQRGAFLIAPAVNINTSTDMGNSRLSKAKTNLRQEFSGEYIIPAKHKDRIRAELDFFNVNEATLFPELEHQMRYIQSQAQHSVGTVEEYKQYELQNTPRPSRDYDKVLLDVDEILLRILPNIDDAGIISRIKNEIRVNVAIIDWDHKDSVISGLRRSITRVLSSILLPNEARYKANEILDELRK